MKRRYVVAIDTTTAIQENALVDYFKLTGVGWWHWIKNFWLIVDGQNKINSEMLRDKIMEFVPGKNVMVIEIPPDISWHGFGPKSEKADMFNWLKDTWKED